MAGIHRIADPALDLDAEDERVEKRVSGHGDVLGQREDRGCNRACRMNHGPEMGVVEVERVRRHAVEKRRVEDVDTLVPAKHGGLRRSHKRQERAQRAVHRFVLRRADGAADPVQHGALRFVHDRGRQFVDLRIGDEAGKRERGLR